LYIQAAPTFDVSVPKVGHRVAGEDCDERKDQGGNSGEDNCDVSGEAEGGVVLEKAKV
jgi:hypothetical protein